jgi:hypothetical protein
MRAFMFITVARTRSLFFSDVVANILYRWREGEGAQPFLSPSGYTGTAPFAGWVAQTLREEGLDVSWTPPVW